jgi:hypothetical protein
MMTTTNTARGFSWPRLMGWGLGALVLLVPAIAMQFTSEVNWDWKDFLFAGVLVGVVGLVLELAARATPNGSYRFGVGVAVMAAFLLTWANAAVGIIGNEDNPRNIMFLVLLLIPAVGAVVVRFRAGGMARVMAATAVGQVTIGLIAPALGDLILVMTAVWGAMWLASAALFRKAAREIAS